MTKLAPTVTDLTVDNAAIDEDGTPFATLTATLSNATTQTVTIDLAYTGTAGGSDYTASSTQITIAPGATTGTATITGQQDTLFEGDETVIATITGVANATDPAPAETVTVTITDDEAAPTVTLSGGASIAENGGVATITATLSTISGLPVTVTLLYGGSATGGTDYMASGASILIPAGSLTGTVTITGVDDLIDESDETVLVDIDTVTNGTENGIQQQTVMITDDDAQPSVSLSGGTSIAENGGTATITATLSAASGLPVTVNLIFSGTATVISDYNRSDTVITIPAGSLTGTVTITGVDDLIDESDETVLVDIDTVTNGTENGIQQQTVTILDDDTSPSVTINQASGNRIRPAHCPYHSQWYSAKQLIQQRLPVRISPRAAAERRAV